MRARLFNSSLSTQFRSRLFQVLRYCRARKNEPEFKALSPTFDYANYRDWTSEIHRNDTMARYWYDSSRGQRSFQMAVDLTTKNEDESDIMRLREYVSDWSKLRKAFERDEALVTGNGLTVAHIAAALDKVEALGLMLRKCCWVRCHKEKKSQMSPLHLAAALQANGAIRCLLNADAPMYDWDTSGNTPFDLVVWSGNFAALRLFLFQIPSAGHMHRDKDRYGLHKSTIVAVRWGYLDVAAYLDKFMSRFYSMVDPQTGCTLFHLLCAYGCRKSAIA